LEVEKPPRYFFTLKDLYPAFMPPPPLTMYFTGGVRVVLCHFPCGWFPVYFPTPPPPGAFWHFGFADTTVPPFPELFHPIELYLFASCEIFSPPPFLVNSSHPPLFLNNIMPFGKAINFFINAPRPQTCGSFFFPSPLFSFFFPEQDTEGCVQARSNPFCRFCNILFFCGTVPVPSQVFPPATARGWPSNEFLCT